MSEAFRILSIWVHIAAAVVWIGGIFFILCIAIPSGRQTLGAEAGRLMGSISKRFTPVANWCIVLLIVTGMALAWTDGGFSYHAGEEYGRTAAMSLKLFMAFLMVAIHFYRGLSLGPKIERAASPERKAALQKFSLSLVWTNLFIGAAVLLLSGAVDIL